MRPLPPLANPEDLPESGRKLPWSWGLTAESVRVGCWNSYHTTCVSTPYRQGLARMGDGDPTLSEHVRDTSQAQCEAQIQSYDVLDNSRRERITAVGQFVHHRSAGSAQRFLSWHSAVYNTFNTCRHLTSASTYRILRREAPDVRRLAAAAIA